MKVADLTKTRERDTSLTVDTCICRGGSLPRLDPRSNAALGGPAPRAANEPAKPPSPLSRPCRASDRRGCFTRLDRRASGRASELWLAGQAAPARTGQRLLAPSPLRLQSDGCFAFSALARPSACRASSPRSEDRRRPSGSEAGCLLPAQPAVRPPWSQPRPLGRSPAPRGGERRDRPAISDGPRQLLAGRPHSGHQPRFPAKPASPGRRPAKAGRRSPRPAGGPYTQPQRSEPARQTASHLVPLPLAKRIATSAVTK